jgi:glycosyltransferase involved in cell wall biosynthesis
MKILSIIIPVYNVEEYIEECLESIIGIKNIEILVVNDCTPDNSMSIVEDYTKLHNNIRIINHTINKGLGATRNTGIEHATGKYLFFLDSDDYLDTNELKRLVNILENIEHEQVLISFNRFDQKKGIWPLEFKAFFNKYNGQTLDHTNFKDLVHIINLSQLRIIKREKVLLDGLRFPDGIYEDILWSYWFAYSCKETLVLDNRIYKYRQRPASILSSTSERHMELIEQYSKTINFFKSHAVPSKYITILQHKFFEHIRFILLDTERLPQNLKQDFYQQSRKQLSSINYQEISEIYSKKRAFKIWSFLHMGYKNTLLYRDSQFLLSKNGAKKIFNLFFYSLLKFFPTSKKIWVFGSRFNKFSDNTKYFYLNNLEQAKKDGIRFIWISQNKHVLEKIKNLGGESYLKHSFKGLFFALLAEYKFVNCWGDDIGFIHTANGKLINFWHGLPLKSIEYDIVSGPQSRPYMSFLAKIRYRITLLRKNDIVFNSSEYFESKIKSSLRPNEIFNLGSPRLDILKKDKDHIKKYLEKYNFKQTRKFIAEIENYKNVYIYMPTFRDTGKSWVQKLNNYFLKINTFLKDTNSCMIFKLHQNDQTLRGIASAYSNIIICDLDDAYPILPFTDCLISDYSSIIFDYMILKKPIILFPFDKQDYIQNSRSLYFDYDKIFKELEQATDVNTLIKYMKLDDKNFSYPILEKKLGKTHMNNLCSSTIYKKLNNFKSFRNN